MSYLFLPASYFRFFGAINIQSFFTYLISPFSIGIRNITEEVVSNLSFTPTQ